MASLRFNIFGVLFAALVSLWAMNAAAQDAPDDVLKVADHFYYDGDFYRAVSEYQRFLALNPNDPRAFSVQLKIAWIYQLAERPENASYELKRLSEIESDARRKRWLSLYLGHALHDIDPLGSTYAFDQVLKECADESEGECRDLSVYATLGKTKYFVEQFRFDDATNALRSLPEKSLQYPSAVNIADYVDGLSIPSKSPFLAGTLSIIPGFGHFYLGEWGIGLVALLWNGIFIGGVVDSVIAERYGQATLIGLLELIWYGGTIFGAVSGAHRYNRDAKQIVADGMLKDLRELDNDVPWPSRFPIDYPRPLQLKVPF